MRNIDWMPSSLPDGWRVARMIDHVRLVNGYPFDSTLFTADQGLPLVRIRDLEGSTTEVCFSGAPVPDAEINRGDILVGMDGEFNVARWAGGRALLNQRLCCLTPYSSLDPAYLAFLLPIPLKLINDLTGSTTVKHLSSFDILKIRLPLPPPNTQVRIGRFLESVVGRIDQLTAAKRRVLDLLAEKRKAIIATAVTRGLDPKVKLRDSGVPWLGEIPTHWDLKRMKYLFRLVADKAPVDNDFELLSLYTDVGVKPRHELEERGNKASSTDEYWMVQPGDLVVNKLLAWMGAFGVSEYRGVTSPAYDILRPYDGVESFFYHHLFRCGAATTEVRARSYGIMDMRLRLYFDRLGDMYVPVAPPDEQRAIVEHIARKTAKLDAVRAATERTIALLKERRSALIAAAVTGQLAVGTTV